MKAIKETGNQLVACLDKSDSVGIIDSYFPQAAFFTELERFDRHIEKLKRRGKAVDYLSICSPNYLHDAHIRFGLRYGADVICEKPLVLNPWNLEALESIEKETGRKIYTILQLRHHPSILALKQQIQQAPKDRVFDVDLTYITSRGKWYYASWKGAIEKSGGIATNIGIHFFDMLIWIFGGLIENEVHIHTHDRAAGYLQLKRARIKWFLSINFDTLPENLKKREIRTFRSIKVDGKEIEFSSGFDDLHTKSYGSILEGKGFGIQATREAISLAHQIRNVETIGLKNSFHPLASLPLTKHPFKKEDS